MIRDLSGLLLLIVDIWAIVQILQTRGDGIKKLLWILLVVFFPLVGFIIWYLAGPKK